MRSSPNGLAPRPAVGSLHALIVVLFAKTAHAACSAGHYGGACTKNGSPSSCCIFMGIGSGCSSGYSQSNGGSCGSAKKLTCCYAIHSHTPHTHHPHTHAPHTHAPHTHSPHTHSPHTHYPPPPPSPPSPPSPSPPPPSPPPSPPPPAPPPPSPPPTPPAPPFPPPNPPYQPGWGEGFNDGDIIFLSNEPGRSAGGVTELPPSPPPPSGRRRRLEEEEEAAATWKQGAATTLEAAWPLHTSLESAWDDAADGATSAHRQLSHLCSSPPDCAYCSQQACPTGAGSCYELACGPGALSCTYSGCSTGGHCHTRDDPSRWDFNCKKERYKIYSTHGGSSGTANPYREIQNGDVIWLQNEEYASGAFGGYWLGCTSSSASTSCKAA
jgi:hypothetical protein